MTKINAGNKSEKKNPKETRSVEAIERDFFNSKKKKKKKKDTEIINEDLKLEIMKQKTLVRKTEFIKNKKKDY